MGQLSTNYLEIARRASLSRRAFNKVFGIGAHKTGTTTLAAVFQLCGLQVGEQDRGELTSYNARRGRYTHLRLPERSGAANSVTLPAASTASSTVIPWR